MFSAVFMVTYAEDARDEAKQVFASRMKSVADAICPINIATETLMPPMPGGDFFCELGFENQGDYEQAKTQKEWAELYALLEDGALVASFEFVAFGDGSLTLQEKNVSKCHRILIYSLLEDAEPAMVAKMESMMNGMTEHVPGLLNCKLSRIVEASGGNAWNYAFECDFDEPVSFLGKYMSTPYHFCHIDKFFEPMCNEWIVDTYLCTPYCAQETPFLANYA